MLTSVVCVGNLYLGSLVFCSIVMSKRKLPTSYSTLRRHVRAQVDADMRSLAGHDNSCSSSDDEFSDNMDNTVVMQSVYTGVNSDGSYTDGDYSDDRSHHRVTCVRVC